MFLELAAEGGCSTREDEEPYTDFDYVVNSLNLFNASSIR